MPGKCFLFFLMFSGALCAQNHELTRAKFRQLDSLEKQLKQGNQNALYGLITYFDQTEHRFPVPYYHSRRLSNFSELSKSIFNAYCLVFREGHFIDFNTCDQKSAANFLDSNIAYLKFDPEFVFFYREDLRQIELDYEVYRVKRPVKKTAPGDFKKELNYLKNVFYIWSASDQSEIIYSVRDSRFYYAELGRLEKLSGLKLLPYHQGKYCITGSKHDLEFMRKCFVFYYKHFADILSDQENHKLDSIPVVNPFIQKFIDLSDSQLIAFRSFYALCKSDSSALKRYIAPDLSFFSSESSIPDDLGKELYKHNNYLDYLEKNQLKQPDSILSLLKVIDSETPDKNIISLFRNYGNSWEQINELTFFTHFYLESRSHMSHELHDFISAFFEENFNRFKSEILEDEAKLDFYLKLAGIYKQIGDFNYATLFRDSDSQTLDRIASFHSDDPDIHQAIIAILAVQSR